MEARGRFERAAGVVVGLVGVFLVALAAELAPMLPSVVSPDPHIASDAMLALVLIGIPTSMSALVTLLIARRLWRRGAGARTLGLLWAAVAAIACAFTVNGSLLWAVRIVVQQPGTWLVQWPRFYHDPAGLRAMGTPLENLPAARIDDLAFWFPGVFAIAVPAVAILLTVGWIGDRRRTRSGTARNSGPIAHPG